MNEYNWLILKNIIAIICFTILAIVFNKLIMFCLFLVINKFNECENKGGTYIQGRCVKKEVLVDDKN